VQEGFDPAPAQPQPTPGPAQPGPIARRLRLALAAGWNLLDQVLSALTNAVLFFLVARSVPVAGVDAFATAFYVFSMLIGVERSLVGQVLSVRFSGVTGRRWRTGVAQGLGCAVGVSVIVSVVMALIALALPPTLRNTLLATALVLPALALQDACRMAFFAQSNARLAALNDLLWAVVQFSAIGVLIGTGTAGAPQLVLAWGGAAAVCCVVALRQLRVVPQPLATVAWFRRHRDMSGFLVGEYLLGAGAFNGGFLVVGALVGTGALAALRGAQVLLGPLGIIPAAVLTFALPELSKRSWLSAAARWKVAVATAGGMTAVSLAYTGGLLLLPHAAGVALFGRTWDGAHSVFLAVALGSTAAGACLGPAVVIYAMGRARATFRLMMVEAPLVFALMIGGAMAGGVRGAAWGLALDQTLLIPLWFLQLRAILRERAPDIDTSPDTSSDTSPDTSADTSPDTSADADLRPHGGTGLYGDTGPDDGLRPIHDSRRALPPTGSLPLAYPAANDGAITP